MTTEAASNLNNNTVQQSYPIRVKRVSELPEYVEHYTDNEYYKNSYIMVAQPSGDQKPHNLRISIDELNEISYTYTAEILNKLIEDARPVWGTSNQ